ncbi:hypothetical protein K438DRAFT_1789401 [Mycena galopus ATCC 62051]|nr:hypothetical protein K438DRAFT_1789401 [Mycena galopus ATCC 62051]
MSAFADFEAPGSEDGKILFRAFVLKNTTVAASVDLSRSAVGVHGCKRNVSLEKLNIHVASPISHTNHRFRGGGAAANRALNAVYDGQSESDASAATDALGVSGVSGGVKEARRRSWGIWGRHWTAVGRQYNLRGAPIYRCDGGLSAPAALGLAGCRSRNRFNADSVLKSRGEISPFASEFKLISMPRFRYLHATEFAAVGFSFRPFMITESLVELHTTRHGDQWVGTETLKLEENREESYKGLEMETVEVREMTTCRERLLIRKYLLFRVGFVGIEEVSGDNELSKMR